MTLTIIRSQHSSSVNFFRTLFRLVSRIALLPFTVFSSQIITKENLFDHFYAGNKVCLRYHTIFFPGFYLTNPLAGELNTKGHGN